MTTEKEYEPKDLIKALEMSGAQTVGNVSTDNARDALILMGLPVKPEKPAPGYYVDRDGSIVIIGGKGVSWTLARHGSEAAAAIPAEDLTPARVVPAAPVEYQSLSDEEADRFTYRPTRIEDDVREAHRMGWDAALAKHGAARELPGREEVRDGLYRKLGTALDDVDRRAVEDAVMALLGGGDRGE